MRRNDEREPYSVPFGDEAIEEPFVAGDLRRAKVPGMEDRHVRTARCFRPTGISILLTLSEDPDVGDIADAARTSVRQIEGFDDQTPLR